jgi:hypothetical protein
LEHILGRNRAEAEDYIKVFGEGFKYGDRGDVFPDILSRYFLKDFLVLVFGKEGISSRSPES